MEVFSYLVLEVLGWNLIVINLIYIEFFDLIFIGFRFFILVKEEYLLKNIIFFVNEC